MGALDRIRDFFFTRAAAPVTEPQGSSGVAAVGGHVQTDERSADMIGTTRYRLFEEWKRNVAPVGGALRACLYLVGAPRWKVKPYQAEDADGPTPEDEERAAWLQRQLTGMRTPWTRVVQAHAMAFFDGAHLGVWTAKKLPDGRYGLDNVMSLPLSSITRWDIDEHGGVRGIAQQDVNGGADLLIDRFRLVYSRDLPTTPNPAGDGAMRFLAEKIRQMQAREKLRNKGYEKDVNGVPVVYAPILDRMAKIGQFSDKLKRTYTRADFDAEMEALVDFVSADVRKHAGLILDSETFRDIEGNPSAIRKYAADVLSAHAGSHDALTEAIRDDVWDLLVLIGFEHLAMGRANGTQAMHVSKMAGTLRIVTSMLNSFAEVGKRDVVRPLWILNAFDPENPADPQNLPTLTWDALEFADLGAVVQSVSAIFTAASVEPGRADGIVNQVLANQGLPPLEQVDPAVQAAEREALAQGLGLGRRGQEPDPALIDEEQ